MAAKRRAGYTVTMFVIDVSPSMGNTRTLELPAGPNGEKRTRAVTNLEWSLQYILLKIQEMIFHDRKTDQCGVILFGTKETDNCVNQEHGGYEHVTEYIPIAHPTTATINRVAALQPSTVQGDAIDGLIVAIQTQDSYLGKKKWTRKIVLLTDGESPLEMADWEETAEKLDLLDIATTVVGVDFDDEDFKEEDKSDTKQQNEQFWAKFKAYLTDTPDRTNLLGSCYVALQDCALPDVKTVTPTSTAIPFRIGDVDVRGDEAIEISVKFSKLTSKAKIETMKKYVKRETGDDRPSQKDEEGDEDMGATAGPVYAQLERRTEYHVNLPVDEEEERVKEEEEEEEEGTSKPTNQMKVDEGDMIRAYKYGATWVVQEVELPKAPTIKGMEVVGFIHNEQWKRWYAMSEVYCIFADPKDSRSQLALSAFVQAMVEKEAMAVVRFVRTDGADAKMIICQPVIDGDSQYMFFVQVPFAEDLRNYTFPSIDSLRNKDGKPILKHPLLATDDMVHAMERWVDKMDIMQEATDEEGNPQPWFDITASYHPAVHRTKQALFHAAIVTNLEEDPIPPPHPEVTKYLEPPEHVVDRSKRALEKLKAILDVKPAPKKEAKKKKQADEATEFVDDDFSLSDIYSGAGAAKPGLSGTFSVSGTHTPTRSGSKAAVTSKDKMEVDGDDDDTEDEEPLPLRKPTPSNRNPFPTPALSPPAARKQVQPASASKAAVPTGPPAKPGRIIGNSRPLYDFKKNLERGDLVSKALEDMAVVIPEIVESSFSNQRYDEAIECMKAMRTTALEEDDVDIWNTFLQSFKRQCKASGFKNSDFWDVVKDVGMALSLITEKEANKHEAYSEFSELQAVQFISD